MQQNEHTEFNEIRRYLIEQCNKKYTSEYWVPKLLVDDCYSTQLINIDSPYLFFLKKFEQIASCANGYDSNEQISVKDVVYQTYIPSFASLNNEIGTFLKQIAFLPFLKRNLGVSVLILLPYSIIGKTNRKGTRGSPFAIKDPFCIDMSLCDALLPKFPAITQYKALIQACDKLGIRVGSIVPLTILSMDSPFFKAFPSLGYWWNADPKELLFAKSPEYTCSIGQPIKKEIHIEESQKLRFVEPPSTEEVITIELEGQSYFTAYREQSPNRMVIALANAFPDPIAGDVNNYTWKDVATISYTRSLFPPPQGSKVKPQLDKSKPAWVLMPLVIAWRARVLGEKCFLIDVNENVPQEILQRATQLIQCWNEGYQEMSDKILLDPTAFDKLKEFFDHYLPCEGSSSFSQPMSIDFIAEELWNFELNNSSISVITGPLISSVSAHSYNHLVLTESLRYHLQLLEKCRFSKYYFGGVANHDTMPPCPEVAPLLYTIYHFLPRSIPMIFSGTEFCSSLIVNKEFGFSSHALQSLREGLKDEDLALFNDIPINWTEISKRSNEDTVEIIPTLQSLHRIRQHLLRLVDDDFLDYRFLEISNSPKCFGYSREHKGAKDDAICIYTNWDKQDRTYINLKKNNVRVIGVVSAYKLQTVDFLFDSTVVLEPLSVTLLGFGSFQYLPEIATSVIRQE